MSPCPCLRVLLGRVSRGSFARCIAPCRLAHRRLDTGQRYLSWTNQCLAPEPIRCETRKRLGPPVPGFVGPADGLPSFAWWVFDCGRMPKGDLLDVIARAGPARRAHLLAVRLAWRDATGWPTRVRAQQQQIIAHARETFTEGGLEAVDQLLATLNLSIPGLGLGLSWLKQATAGYAISQEEITALRPK